MTLYYYFYFHLLYYFHLLFLICSSFIIYLLFLCTSLYGNFPTGINKEPSLTIITLLTVTSKLCPSFRPQNIELGATGGASKQDSSNMDDMTVEQMTMRANQVTDEVLSHINRTDIYRLSFSLSAQNYF